MKRFLSALLFAALVLTLASCSDGETQLNEDGLIPYSESGLEFALPENMERHSVTYANLCYGDGKAEFFADFFSRDVLMSEWYLDKDVTVKEFAEERLVMSMCDELVEEYDEPNQRIKYTFVAEDSYYVAIFMRNYDCLIHATMCCPIEMKEDYLPAFETWEKYIALTYPDR